MALQHQQRDLLSPGRQGWEGFLEEGSLRDLNVPGVNPGKGVLVRGEARGEPVLKEAPRLEVQGLVLEPAMKQCPGVAGRPETSPHPPRIKISLGRAV